MDTSNYPLPVIDCSIATLEPVFTGAERRLGSAGRAEPLYTAESDQVCHMDINLLVQRGTVQKAYGYVSYNFENAGKIIPFDVRNTIHTLEKQAVMSKAARHYFILDDSKFGEKSLLHLCPVSRADAVCTNRLPEAAYVDYCQEHGIPLLTADS